jgi:AraC-like DNA-binding protein
MDGKSLTDQVIEFVMTSSDEALKELTVAGIARRFNVDRSHLSREFKSDKNFTLCNFIQREKVARAAISLRDSDALRIENLSKKLGFCSTEYFREVFKRYHGISPSKYRAYRNQFKNEKPSVRSIN